MDISSLALRSCGKLLIFGFEGGGGGRCWSPEVANAGAGGGCKGC